MVENDLSDNQVHRYLVEHGWSMQRVNGEDVYTPPRAAPDPFSGQPVAYPLRSAYALQQAADRRRVGA